MVDTKTPGDKTLSVPTKTLTLKPRVETGTVRQSFSHGRTKQVVVEKRGKRRVGGDAPLTETHAPEPVVAKAAPAKAPLARPATPPAPPRLPTPKSATSRNGVWRKRKPSAATARKASSRPSAKPPKPAARPRKSVIARTRKPSARPNSKPRNVSAKPKPRPPPRPPPPPLRPGP